MSYNGSKAITGAGSILSIGSVPTAVGEIIDIKLSGRKWDTDDVTNMNSTMKEFISAIADPGEWSCTFNRVSADAGQVALEAAFASGVVTAFVIQLPKTAAQTTKGDSYTFNALVTEVNYSFEPTKADKGDCKLKVSGPITPVAGS